MSRNAKNARVIKLAKEVSAMHKAGNKGPAQTTPKHGKQRRNRALHNNPRKGVQQNAA